MPDFIVAHMLPVLRRPFLGPLIIGMFGGGVPAGIYLYYCWLHGSWDQHFFVVLTPLIVAVTIAGAIASSKGGAKALRSSLLTSLSACVPIPTAFYIVAASKSGYEISDPRNLPFAVSLFVLWALAVAFLCWTIILIVAFVFEKGKGATGNL